MPKIWFITGSSRGLGRSLTEAVLAAGDKVAATARDPGQLGDLAEKYKEQLYLLKLDVTRRDEAYQKERMVLGSEAIAILEKANAARDAELQEWRSVSTSTDADDADTSKFFSTGFGKTYK